MQASATTADALAQALAPRRQAILIGIDAYDDPAFPPLQHAVADADALAEIFRDETSGGFDDVLVLGGAQAATRAAVVRALAEARQDLRRQDQVVVYFSGHGTRVRDGEVWRRFLLVGDSRARDLEGTALDLETLQAYMRELAPERKALVVDACFRGDGKSVVRPGAERPALQDEATPGALGPSQSQMGAGEAHLYATTSGRPSRESDRLGHGVYTYYLLQALSWGFADADLDGDGAVTAYEAHDFARARAITFTEGAQIPEATFRTVGEADLILSGAGQTRARVERALVYLYDARARLEGAVLTVDGRDRGTFPGTVPLEPGRHHLVLRDADGRVVLDGSATFTAGRSYAAPDLVRVLQGPKRVGGLSLGTVQAPSLHHVIGTQTTSVEAWWMLRRNRAPLRGVYHRESFGLAWSPTRLLGGQELDAARGLGWLRTELGVQRDGRFLRYRAGWGLGLVLIPPSYVSGRPELTPEPGERPSEEGWLFLVQGPVVGLGWVTPVGLSLGIQARGEGAWLAVEPDGPVSLVPWITAGAGAELSW